MYRFELYNQFLTDIRIEQTWKCIGLHIIHLHISMCFVDSRNAYMIILVAVCKLFQILEAYISSKVTQISQIINVVYEDTKILVKLRNDISDYVKTDKGVIQGWPSILLILYVIYGVCVCVYTQIRIKSYDNS